MKLASQPFRRNLRANPDPRNVLSTCTHCASLGSAGTLANSFLSYHILVNKAVSCSYELFCATARLYLSCFQSLPHSFYCHGGGGASPITTTGQPVLGGAPATRSHGLAVQGSQHRLGAVRGINAHVLGGEVAGPIARAGRAGVQVHHDGYMVR